MKTFGYCRISTAKQSIDRQIQNIRTAAPDAIIMQEVYSGTTIDRPVWNRLMKMVKAGDTVIFDEVSRMSRDADEGFAVYQDLMQRDVNLVFLKEHHIDTATYKNAIRNGVPMTGTDVEYILEGVNKFLMSLAKEQIRIAFQSAESEVTHLHQRTSEGVRRAMAAGKQVGRAAGVTVETKKAIEMKKKIRQMSKDFDGCMSDKDCMETLKLARNTYYKYKKQIKEGEES